MATIDDLYPERGDPKDWVELEGEEARCLTGLKKYYIVAEDEHEQSALTKAWADLKREFLRLEHFLWYK